LAAILEVPKTKETEMRDAECEEDRGRISYALGQTYALKAFAHALIHTYPAKSELAKQFQISSQAGLARIEALLVLEETIEGFLDVSNELSSALSQENA
jgi:hypothetical protein